MPRYRLTREFTTTGTLEVNASSPEEAVRIAYGRQLGAWKLDGGHGASPIDAVSEAKRDGRCWGVAVCNNRVELQEDDEEPF